MRDDKAGEHVVVARLSLADQIGRHRTPFNQAHQKLGQDTEHDPIH
jgi:hypothetical protein